MTGIQNFVANLTKRDYNMCLHCVAYVTIPQQYIHTNHMTVCMQHVQPPTSVNFPSPNQLVNTWFMHYL